MTLPRIDKGILLQTLRGYEEMNRLVERELKSKLPQRTPQESMAIFADLYATWSTSGQIAGDDLGRLKLEKLEQKIKLRRTFDNAARLRGLR